MTNEANLEPDSRWRFQFSIATLLMLMAIVALSIALGLTYGRLARVERQLDALQPMSPEEVARQFEKNTTLGMIKTKVGDVRYSPKEDAFRVRFSWTDSTSGETWTSDVKLTADGFGRYFGQIRNPEFTRPLGYTDSYPVGVETPSPLKTR